MNSKYKHTNFSPWSTGPVPLGDCVGGVVRCDVAIVGAGFAGLSVAYHLLEADPELDVVVIEARRVGSGASGLNTGMLGPGAVAPIDQLLSRWGQDDARETYAASREAVRCVKRLIAREGLRCDFEPGPQLKVARTDARARLLRGRASVLSAMGFKDVHTLDAAALKARLHTSAYRAALVLPDAALLNPARLASELARVVRERGGRIFERSPVERIEPGPVCTLRCVDGRVEAERVVVAAGARFGDLDLKEGRIVPMVTHAVATDPTAAARVGIEEPLGVIDGRRLFSYFRFTRDGRLIYGGGTPRYRGAASPRRAQDTWRALHREIIDVFPALASVEIEGRWSGEMGFTLDGAPVVARVEGHPNLMTVGGFCGHGVALATGVGPAVVEMMLNDRETLPVRWRRPNPRRLPSGPLRTAGLELYIGGLGLADRLGALAGGRNEPGFTETMTPSSVKSIYKTKEILS